MGFVTHFYIIFGTNLLTGGLAQIDVFCLFQSFAEKEYQTESKRNETFRNVIFGTNMIQETWTLSQGSFKEATSLGARPTPVAAPSTLVAASWLLRLHLQVSWVSSGPRKIIAEVLFRLDSVWYSFSTKL